MGVSPDRLARELSDRGQLGSVAADVLRGKALTLLAERAAVTDESGRPVDITAAAREADDADSDGDAGQSDAGGSDAGGSDAAEPAAEARTETGSDGDDAPSAS